MIVGTVEQLWRYPVKSMAGERLAATRVGARGIPGDRGWAVYDEARRGITSGKRVPALRMCEARYRSAPDPDAAPPVAEITWPGGAPVLTDAADAAVRLGDFVGRRVSLRALGPPGSESAPRLTMEMETAETVRDLNGLAPGEPMPDYGDLTPERLRALRRESFFDAYSIHLITRTTLRTLGRIAPESNWDDRRFRANVYLACTAPGDYPELEWVGRRLRLGAAMLRIEMGCPRCVMVTQATGDVPQDHRIMRTLVRETRHTAGVYASVLEPGNVRVGDEVELLGA